MKELIQSILKSMRELVHNYILSLILGLAGSLPSYYFLLEKQAAESSNYIKWSTKMIALLTFLTIFLLISWLRLYFKYERFKNACGVFWDKAGNMRCMVCKKFLKYTTGDPCIVTCPDTKCDSKYTLRNQDGDKLTEKQARDLLKNNKI